jgi:CubicO group peptidase (beta-lactamase class C family)
MSAITQGARAACFLLLTIGLSVATPALAQDGPGKGPWSFAQPEAHGLDKAKLEAAAAEIAKIGGRQGLVIVRDGVIVFEKYWTTPYYLGTPSQRDVSFSSGKSWGSAMVGVAVREGHLKIDDLVRTYVSPEESGLRPQTTLRDLLTMSSGGTMMQKPPSRSPAKRDEPVATATGPGPDYKRMTAFTGDEVGAPVGYGTTIPPGTLFRYDGAASDHVSDVVAGAVHQGTHGYIETHLLRPLGVENFDYQPEGVDPKGDVRIGGSIEVSVRDMARLGQLWLNGGRWGGRQLVDADYVRQSVSPSKLNPGYGLLWWLNDTGRIGAAPRSMFYAAGAYGQYAFVLPEQHIVVATMGFDPAARGIDQAVAIWNSLGPALGVVPKASGRP